MPGGQGFSPSQESLCRFVLFATLPFHSIHIHHIDGFFRPSPVPYRIARIAKMKQYVEFPFTGIIDTIPIINKLPGGSDLILPVLAMNDLNPVPFFILVRVEAGTINGNIMSPL